MVFVNMVPCKFEFLQGKSFSPLSERMPWFDEKQRSKKLRSRFEKCVTSVRALNQRENLILSRKCCFPYGVATNFISFRWLVKFFFRYNERIERVWIEWIFSSALKEIMQSLRNGNEVATRRCASWTNKAFQLNAVWWRKFSIFLTFDFAFVAFVFNVISLQVH